MAWSEGSHKRKRQGHNRDWRNAVGRPLRPEVVSASPKQNTLMHVGADYHSIAGGPRADITGRANLEYNPDWASGISPVRCRKSGLTAHGISTACRG
jgi:hypothetical protein